MKKSWKIWGVVILFIVATVTLIQKCKNTNQAMLAMPLHYTLTGSYSQNGGEWLPLDENTKLSAFDGDVVLKGHFDYDVGQDATMYFFLKHIGMSMYVNEEIVFYTTVMEAPLMSSFCGVTWNGCTVDEIKTTDQVEIHLKNPHSFGNEDAYNEFLHHIYGGSEENFESYITKQGNYIRAVGLTVLVMSFILLGTALAAVIMRIKVGKLLGISGFMSFFAAIFLMLDTKDVIFWSELNVFNTYARQICMMLAAFTIGLGVIDQTKGRQRQIATMTMSVSGGINLAIFLLSEFEICVIYDTNFYWVISQVPICFILCGCIISEFLRTENKNRMILGLIGILIGVELLELINIPLDLWEEGFCAKIVFLIVFVFGLGMAVRTVPMYYRYSIIAKELEGELRNNRIVLAMSQIRTHFIFNVLNAISGMCKYDPEKADETVVRFARYLRNNIDIMQEDELVPFKKALEHLDDYIALEQVRFGDKIKYVKNLQVENFLIPPLVLQPVVENAIKHGLMPKAEGGTILLCTQTDEEKIIITISDDGAGYNPKEAERDGAVGISNVRFRLEQMIHGTIEINSKPDEGTVTTITLPCKEALKCM